MIITMMISRNENDYNNDNEVNVDEMITTIMVTIIIPFRYLHHSKENEKVVQGLFWRVFHYR